MSSPKWVKIALLLALAALLSCSGCMESPEEKFARLKQRAIEYREEGKLEEARISLQQAIDIRPDDPEAILELAEVQLRLRQWRKALENYRTVTNLDPANKTARMRLVAMLIAARQYEFAESELAKLMEESPNDRDGLLLRAGILQGRGKLEEADRLLRELLADGGQNDPIVLAKLAEVQIAQGDFEGGEQNLLKALAAAPDNGTIRMALGALYTSQGRLEEAQEAIEEVVSQEPDQAALRLYFAEFLLRRGLVDRAFEEYEETLRKDPLRHLARDRLYDFYILRGEREKAQALTRELAEVAEAEGAYAYFRGRDEELAGDLRGALEHYIQSIQLLRRFGPAFRRAGLAELRLGKRAEALEHLGQAVTLEPGDVAARIALARDAFARKNYGVAAEHVAQVLERYPGQQAANIIKADILMLKGDLDQARAIYETFAKRFPANPSAYIKLGVVDEQQRNYKSAVSNYRRALDTDRKVLLPAQRLLAIIRETKGLDAAIAEAEELLGSSKRSKPEYSLLLASLLIRDEKNVGANIDRIKELLSFAADERSGMPEAQALLASVLMSQGDFEAARKGYQSLVQRHPHHIPSLMILAGLAQRQGDYEEAARYYRSVLEADRGHAHAANNLAWLLADKLNGDLDEALRLAQSAKEQRPRDGNVTDTLAWIYFLRGQPRAARNLMEEAIQLAAVENPGGTGLGSRYFRLAEIKFALNDKDGASEALARAEASEELPENLASKVDDLKRRLNEGEQ